MNKYQKQFNDIKVSSEMEERIVKKVLNKKNSFLNKKSIMVGALAFTLMLSVGILTYPKWSNNKGSDPMVQIPNPIKDNADFSELDFTFKSIFEIPTDYKLESTKTIANTIGELTYTSDNDKLSYRMAEGSDDISGDYNVYEKEEKVDNITLKGNGGKINLASWQDSEFTYAISSEKGLAKEVIIKMIESIK